MLNYQRFTVFPFHIIVVLIGQADLIECPVCNVEIENLRTFFRKGDVIWIFVRKENSVNHLWLYGGIFFLEEYF